LIIFSGLRLAEATALPKELIDDTKYLLDLSKEDSKVILVH
jgi:hypothetical protein